MSIRKILLTFLGAFLALFIYVTAANLYVSSMATSTYNEVENIPKNKVGLVLGTVKTLSSGNTNYYYKYRIEAANRLFKAGKIDYLLVSGDNNNVKYDEPTDMKNDLVNLGVPENRIYLDYAGFRTLDSVVRAKEIFGQEKVTIISQQFHNERAIAIAKSKEITAVGYNAKGISRRYGWRVMLREVFARAKMVADIILGVQPKFLGDKIEIR